MSGGQDGQEGQEGVGGGGQGGKGGRGGQVQRPMQALMWSLAVMIVVVFGTSIGSIAYQQHVVAERIAADVASCKRGQIVRAKQNAVIVFLNAKFGFDGVPTPQIDCSTIK